MNAFKLQKFHYLMMIGVPAGILVYVLMLSGISFDNVVLFLLLINLLHDEKVHVTSDLFMHNLNVAMRQLCVQYFSFNIICLFPCLRKLQ
ncbi:hypothetical protein MUK42_30565 [Musa troglodytarum]|uniref:Uncharacterized protein n=1 Tax=Musa troglodytarum TaxID=320322 RepID=A0A9E7GCQ1_9LILI|nr:hypothetical protein MUK42_30565 [Musa troglodytarum]